MVGAVSAEEAADLEVVADSVVGDEVVDSAVAGVEAVAGGEAAVVGGADDMLLRGCVEVLVGQV